MSRKILVTILAVAMLLVAVPIVLGATDKDNSQIAQIQKQILDLKKQLIQKYVESGQITPDQGKFMEQRMDQMYDYAQKNGFQPGFGYGCGGVGGMMGGYGYGPWGKQGAKPGAAPQSYNNL